MSHFWGSNEMLLIASLLVFYSIILLLFALFRKQGLYLWTIVATITANIEVMILVNAFGMDMTLGNVLFASTFLVTDMLSEIYGKKEARTAVCLGIATSLSFILISQSWFLYHPAAGDTAYANITKVFANTPRLMFVSIAVYIVVQVFDVWLYHAWWKLTVRKTGDHRRYLWLRNNGSTMISQLLNTVLYTWGAFFGIYDTKTLVSIAISSYVIFLVTSLADTPFLYLARRLADRLGIDEVHHRFGFSRYLER